MKKLQIDFSESINEGDVKSTTWVCRHTNPDICGKNSIPGIYAFTTYDCICRKPSRAWRKNVNR